MKFKDARFNLKTLPTLPELQQPYKTFLLIKDAIKDDNDAWYRNIIHPFRLLKIAEQKKLTIPRELLNILNMRYQENLENEKKGLAMKAKKERDTVDDKPITTRERNTLMKSIGILALILAEEKEYASECIINNRLNASKIANVVSAKAEAMGIPIEGLKSINRKIVEAVRFLQEEFL